MKHTQFFLVVRSKNVKYIPFKKMYDLDREKQGKLAVQEIVNMLKNLFCLHIHFESYIKPFLVHLMYLTCQLYTGEFSKRSSCLCIEGYIDSVHNIQCNKQLISSEPFSRIPLYVINVINFFISAVARILLGPYLARTKIVFWLKRHFFFLQK